MAEIRSTMFVAHLAVNYKTAGAEEMYWLQATNFNAAAAATLKIAEARSFLLGDGASIEWVDLRTALYPAVSWPLLQDPIPALQKPTGQGYWSKPDNPQVGLWWMWRAEDGAYATRIQRFMPDAEIIAGDWIRQGLQIPAVTPAKPTWPGIAQPNTLYRYAIGTIRDLTVHCRPLADLVDGTHQFEVRQWKRVQFSKRGTKNIGDRFNRITWEPGDWTQAPAFSPCGCPVGVSRRTFDVQCYFYVNGQKRSIRYYRASPGAKILPFGTIFWGWFQDQKIKNTSGPGELTGPGKRTWNAGWGYSAPLGLAPFGPPAAFLGNITVPFDDTVDTPLALRPPCNMPIVSPLKVDLDDGSVVDPDVIEQKFHVDDFDIDDSTPQRVKIKLKQNNLAVILAAASMGL